MSDKIYQAFDNIKAEKALKDNTMQFIRSQERCQKKKYSMRRMAVALASLLILIISGGISYQVYATPDAYMDVDVNPSIELAINMFGRVIGVHAYNEDGKKILSTVNLKNKDYQEALDILLAAMEKEGYMEESQLLSITVSSDHKQEDILQSLQQHNSSCGSGHHTIENQEIFSVDAQTKASAYEMNVSPAQYLAIQALRRLDPQISIEECQNHTITELREIASDHDEAHHQEGEVKCGKTGDVHH